MAAISQTTLSAFPWLKSYEIWIKFDCNMFLCLIEIISALVQMMALRRLGYKSISELNVVRLRIYASLGFNELRKCAYIFINLNINRKWNSFLKELSVQYIKILWTLYTYKYNRLDVWTEYLIVPNFWSKWFTFSLYFVAWSTLTLLPKWQHMATRN